MFLPLKYSFTVFTLLLRIETALRGKFPCGFPQEMWHKSNIPENKSTREEKKKAMNWSRKNILINFYNFIIIIYSWNINMVHGWKNDQKCPFILFLVCLLCFFGLDTTCGFRTLYMLHYLTYHFPRFLAKMSPTFFSKNALLTKFYTPKLWIVPESRN